MNNTEMQQQLELHLHEQYALNNNSTLTSMLTLFVSMLAVIYGYGYVFLNSVDRLEGVAMKVDGSYSWYALLFTNVAATLVLTAISCICVKTGYKGRMEQFITHAIRKKYYPDVEFDAIFPNGYNPYKSGWFKAIQGPYDTFLVIILFLVAVMNIATIYRGCHAQVGAEVWCGIFSLLFYALICFLAILKCYNKFMIRKAEYVIKEKIQKNSTLKSKILAMLKMKLFEIRTSLVVRHLFLVFLGLMCYAGAMAEEESTCSSKVVINGIRYELVERHVGLTVEREAYVVGNTLDMDYDWGVWIPEHIYYGDSYSVTQIKSKAFLYLSITSVEIPQSVTTVASDAFLGCNSITSVTLPGHEGVIASKIFPNYKIIEKATMASGAKLIGSGTFNGCSSLKYVYNTWNISDVGEDAFCECSSLDSIEFNGVPVIGARAFQNCTSLTKFYCGNSYNSDDTLVIPEKAFMGCVNLESIMTGNECLRIKIDGVDAFRGCTNLSELSRCYYDKYKKEQVYAAIPISKLKESAFMDCVSLLEVSVSDTIIPDYAFYGCTSLQPFHISQVERIGRCAFKNCTNFKEKGEDIGLKNLKYSSFGFRI